MLFDKLEKLITKKLYVDLSWYGYTHRYLKILIRKPTQSSVFTVFTTVNGSHILPYVPMCV